MFGSPYLLNATNLEESTNNRFDAFSKNIFNLIVIFETLIKDFTPLNYSITDSRKLTQIKFKGFIDKN